jgi:hypothetical protein
VRQRAGTKEVGWEGEGSYDTDEHNITISYDLSSVKARRHKVTRWEYHLEDFPGMVHLGGMRILF